MQSPEIKRSTVFNAASSVEYISHSIATKVISKCPTGSVTVLAFDSAEILTNSSSAFDSLMQVLEGEADVAIRDSHSIVRTGQSIIIPAHAPSSITAHGRLKMQSTIMKCGYEA